MISPGLSPCLAESLQAARAIKAIKDQGATGGWEQSRQRLAALEEI